MKCKIIPYSTFCKAFSHELDDLCISVEGQQSTKRRLFIPNYGKYCWLESKYGNIWTIYSLAFALKDYDFLKDLVF